MASNLDAPSAIQSGVQAYCTCRELPASITIARVPALWKKRWGCLFQHALDCDTSSIFFQLTEITCAGHHFRVKLPIGSPLPPLQCSPQSCMIRHSSPFEMPFCKGKDCSPSLMWQLAVHLGQDPCCQQHATTCEFDCLS